MTTGPEEQKETLEQKTARFESELNEHIEKTKNKTYAVLTNDGHLTLLLNFLEKEARWNGMEALGVVELYRKIEKVRQNGIKNGAMHLKKLELDALAFFHSHGAGKGYASANNFIEMVKPFNEPLKEAKSDYDKQNNLEMRFESAKSGLDIEDAIEKKPVEEFEEDGEKN